MRNNNVIYSFLAIILVFLCGFCSFFASSSVIIINESVNYAGRFVQNCYANNNSEEKRKNENLTSAEAMATIEANSGRVLFCKNESKKLPMASTTKIITAIVAIENCKDLDKKQFIPKEAVGIEGSSIYLRANEMLSIRELLYGLMLRSGNDSAVAIAILIAGSVDNFVKLMNDFCKKLNLNDTNIITVNGLHDDNHYTTALDLARVTAYALANKTFAEIVSTKNAIIDDNNAKNGKRYLKNKNKLLWTLDGSNGVKTGYTKKAGRCFVGSATRGKMKIVCVVLNCVPMFEDCKSLIEKSFDEFRMITLFRNGVITEKEILSSGQKFKLPVFLTEDLCYPLKDSELNYLSANIKFKENIELPLSHSNEIGEIEIMLKNNLIFSQKLYTINADKTKEKSYFQKIIRAF